MLRKFKITIDGQEYLVEMEELDAQNQPIQKAVVDNKQDNKKIEDDIAASKKVATEVSNDSNSQNAMMSPMPGTVLKILVNQGDQVEENQPLLILEAMKMENEIVAENAGIVSEIFVTKNQSVNAGDALITIQ